MRPIFVVILAVAVFSAGIYIGVSGLVSNYSVVPSGSDASDAAVCTPSKAVVAVGEPVTFLLNIADVAVFWSTTEGRMQWVPQTGRPQFIFASPGEKTAYAMVGTDPQGAYRRVSCPVTVR